MQYQEYKPLAAYSQHVECHWNLQLHPYDLVNPSEMLSPDCTFEILFSEEPFYYRKVGSTQWLKTRSQALFMGQKTRSFTYKTSHFIEIFGIRFKPFAFGKLTNLALSNFNDQILPLQVVLPIDRPEAQIIQKIIKAKEINYKLSLTKDLLAIMLPFGIDESLRAQTNYILDRKGMVKIKDMYSVFSTTKLSLANSFSNKIGLSPKNVSRIWRMNYFLFLQSQQPHKNFTQLSLEAGYYDQAHFIKEFKSYFASSPRRFYQNESQLLRISQLGIQKRFTRQYDPFIDNDLQI